MRFKRLDKPSVTLKENVVVFGEGSPEEKQVEVRKITIELWRELFDVIYSLPQLIVGVMSAKPDERAAYLVVALDQSLEEISHIVSVLTGIDLEWLKKNVSLDELVAYFTAVAKVNNFGDLLKNVQSVLALAAAQNAN